jgi:hypothetical protein
MTKSAMALLVLSGKVTVTAGDESILNLFIVLMSSLDAEIFNSLYSANSRHLVSNCCL